MCPDADQSRRPAQRSLTKNAHSFASDNGGFPEANGQPKSPCFTLQYQLDISGAPDLNRPLSATGKEVLSEGEHRKRPH